MMQTSLIHRLKMKFEHWKEIAGQRHALLYGGQALAKDLGVSTATLQYEARQPAKGMKNNGRNLNHKTQVVKFSSKAFHKAKMLH